MGGLVSQDQICGVLGRSCSWNLILLRDMLDWVEERNLPLALISIDQEKAFDRWRVQLRPGERVPERGGGAGWGGCGRDAHSPRCSTSCSWGLLLGWCAGTRVSTVFGSRGRRVKS
ncbi:hypothetical protein AAFF_G00083770 [Aldrovandia affinis]|uniref:Reverse transcriptase domain-containing protein n=1 Tax=Aldrovandia affinis TaxID=143900 RepID=A0AAD7RWX6_9TELE|nr:hypothetical protein AAFF_G00083770 [Aldrovandia affinis]